AAGDQVQTDRFIERLLGLVALVLVEVGRSQASIRLGLVGIAFQYCPESGYCRFVLLLRVVPLPQTELGREVLGISVHRRLILLHSLGQASTLFIRLAQL